MTKPTTFKLSAPVAAEIDRIAAERGVTRSDILREAVDAYVRGRRRSRLADRVADLVGVLEGPGDLSTNPAHLEDFGS
ncbi:MAG: ribbon-helix-helix domain-containing protein [Myxococcota bacterium]|nr:ribbon-helix-helix domain-containing protein [Myxococcota bacterium]